MGTKAETPEPANRVSALGALYQAERQDAAGMLVTALAVVSGGLTYLGVAAVLINNVTLPGARWFPAAIADAFVLHQDRPSTRGCVMDPLDISDLLVSRPAVVFSQGH